MTIINLEKIEFDPNDSDLKIAYPYPEIGDSLLQSCGEKLFYTQTISGKWMIYAEAYKQAADMLVEQVSGLPNEDRLICPILYLYRHFLELTLKYIVRRLSCICNDPIPENAMGLHDLSPLWSFVIANLKYTDSQFDDSIVKTVGKCVKEINNIDPKSMLFRYPQDKKQKVTFLPNHVDAENLKKVIDKLSNFFNEIGIAVEFREEWVAEMGSWF